MGPPEDRHSDRAGNLTGIEEGLRFLDLPPDPARRYPGAHRRVTTNPASGERRLPGHEIVDDAYERLASEQKLDAIILGAEKKRCIRTGISDLSSAAK